MTRLVYSCLSALLIATISGCLAGSGSFGWVTDSEQSLGMSGFSIQAPTGQNWYRAPKNDNFPNLIQFIKIMQTPIRNNTEHPEFSITTAVAFGTDIGTRLPRKTDKNAGRKALQQCLQQYQQKAGFTINDSSYDIFLGAECISYKGKQINPEENRYWGTIRYESVTGYLCLHPDYDNFVVVMESKTGASVGMMPVNRDDQTNHFFRSMRFTPRNLPAAPAGAPPKDEGKRRTS